MGGAPGYGGGDYGGHRGGQHRGAVAGNAGDAAADGLGHRRQQRGAHRGADLAAGVDHAADQALIGVRHPPAGEHHHAERGARRAEADQRDHEKDRAVPGGGQAGRQDHEAGRGHGAGQHQQAPHADAGGQPGAEQARGEAHHALRGDDQAGEQRRLVQHLLQVQRQHEHLAAVPQAEQERQRAAVTKPPAAQEFRVDQRVRVPCFGLAERGGRGGGRRERDDDRRRGPAEHRSLGYREHAERDRGGDQQSAADVEVPAGAWAVCGGCGVRSCGYGACGCGCGAFCACGGCLACGAEDGGGEGGGGQADGDVDFEYGAPAGELDQHAAQHLAGDEADG
jgi:hypothetical protein